MKTEVSGFKRKVVTGTDYNGVLKLVDQLIQEGYEIHKATKKIKWPYFWIKAYRVKMRKHFIFIDEEIVYYSKKDIERMKP